MKETLNNLADKSDSLLCIAGNYINETDMLIEFVVQASEGELEAMFFELFNQSDVTKDACRNAILLSDYGKTDLDLGVN